MLLSFLFAVLAAGSNAASNVLQRKANREQPTELQLRPRLIWELLHEPVWLAGVSAVMVSFVLLTVALDNGQVAAVQPVVVLELPLTLIGGQLFFGARLGRREWLATGLLTGGLVGLLAFLYPQAGHGQIGWVSWLVGMVASLVAVAVLVVSSLGGGTGRRAALLGCATGVTFGLTAALMKGMTRQFSHGPVGVLTAWQTYAMVAAGVGGMFLAQSALNAGRLIAAQPGMTLLDPFTAILWGVFGFGERVSGGGYLGLAVVSGLVLAAGAALLATSNLLEDAGRGGRAGGAGPRA